MPELDNVPLFGDPGHRVGDVHDSTTQLALPLFLILFMLVSAQTVRSWLTVAVHHQLACLLYTSDAADER